MRAIVFQFLLEQTVWIPISFCLIGYKKIKPVYLPLFFYLLAKEAAEIASLIIIEGFGIKNNAPPYNILYLLEATLVTWLLYNIGTFRPKKLYIAVQLFWVTLWLTDITLIGDFNRFNQVFRITYTFLLVIAMAGVISRLAITVRLRLYRHTAFIICVAFAFWFLYNMLYEFTDYISNYNVQFKPLGVRLTEVISFAEIALYLLLAWAVYCIPARKHFINIQKVSC